MPRIIRNIVEQFRMSSREFSNVKTLAVCGMMAAIGVVLGYFTIPIGDYLKIGFSSIPNQCVYALFGPAVGCAFGGILDILKFIIKPTGAFFPGFTLNAMIAGVIYGIAYYKHELTYKRIFIAELITAVIVNMLLNTLWLSMMYGKAFMVLLPPRVIKNLIQVPVNAFVFFTISKVLQNFRILNMMQN